MGIGKYIKKFWPKVKIVAVEPSESPVMSGGEPGLHGIQGIGDGSKFLVDLEFIDEVVTVSTDNAKKVNKMIKDMKFKVQSQIQGEQLRVTGKKIDDLQGVITALNEAKLDFPLQFVNMKS